MAEKTVKKEEIMSHSKRYLLGIDLGTTNIKGIIMDEDGCIITTASKNHELIMPGPNMVEQDAALWWKHSAQIMRSLTTAAGPDIVKNICGISVSSQTVSMLPLDKDGNILRNAIIWMDSRSGQELTYILDTMGFNKFVATVGAQPDSAFLPSKLLWYKKHEPELFEKTDCVLQASSYINFKLTGQRTMDIDQAGKCQCLDIHTLEWSKDIGNTIGIDLNKILPKPRLVHEIIGEVTEAAARETGLCQGTPVAAGTSDSMASMYASGLCRLGEAGESSGTSSLVFIGHSSESDPTLPVVAKPCSIKGMPYVFDAPITASGAAIKWYLDNLGAADHDYAKEHHINVYDYINKLALESDPGSNGVLFFPYLLGERAPLWNSHAKGMFIGLSLDTQRKDLIRSVFEGTSFALRHVIDTIKNAGATASCLRITGGGSKSRTWCQIKASMLHMPVYILDEGSGDVPFGDCLIAGQAAGVFTNLGESIDRLIKVKEIIEPNQIWANIYDELYPYYLDMYRHLDPDLIKLEATMQHIRDGLHS